MRMQALVDLVATLTVTPRLRGTARPYFQHRGIAQLPGRHQQISTRSRVVRPVHHALDEIFPSIALFFSSPSHPPCCQARLQAEAQRVSPVSTRLSPTTSRVSGGQTSLQHQIEEELAN